MRHPELQTHETYALSQRLYSVNGLARKDPTPALEEGEIQNWQPFFLSSPLAKATMAGI